jgi:hypothetical protein
VRNPEGSYVNIYVLEGGRRVDKPSRLAEPIANMWAQRPKDARFFARWFPKLGVHRVYDVKQFTVLPNKKLFMPGPVATFKDVEPAVAYMTLRV